VAGLATGFGESGLSFDTGFGYIEGRESSVHMMTEWIERDEPDPPSLHG
jgi:hypothetical protein